MRIKFIKPHPTLHKNNKRWNYGALNYGASPIKGMNLIMQGYAILVHSCRNCNPYHIDMKDYENVWRFGIDFKESYCNYKDNRESGDIGKDY